MNPLSPDEDPRLAGVHKANDHLRDLPTVEGEGTPRILWLLEGIVRVRALVQAIETVIDAPGNEDLFELMKSLWLHHVETLAMAEEELRHLRGNQPAV